MLRNNIFKKLIWLFGISKIHVIFLIIFSFIFFFWNLGENSFRHLDEALFAQISKEMLNTGDWITLHIRGKPFFHKPPLRIWLNSFAFIIFGVNEFAARFWSAISSLGIILIVYFFAKNIYDKKTGFLSSLILLFSNQFLFERFSRSVEEDATVVFFICLSLYFFWLSRKQKFYIYISIIFISFIFMMKSGVALLPILIILSFLLTTKEFRLYTLRNWIILLIIFLIIILPWHILQYLISSENFIKIYFAEFLYFLKPTLLLEKNPLINFITPKVIERIGQGCKVSPFLNIWFYVYTIMIGFFPWSIVLFFAVVYLFKVNIDRHNNNIEVKDIKGNILILNWFFSPLIILSLLYIKRTWSINLIYPAMAILTGKFFIDSFNKKNSYIHHIGIILGSIFIINLSPNQYGLPYYTFCPWLEYRLNFLLLNNPRGNIFRFSNLYPGLIIIILFSSFFIYMISKNKFYFKKILSVLLLGYLLICSGVNSLYLVSRSNFKSDMHIIVKKIEEITKSSVSDLIIWDSNLFRMQFGVLNPEFPSQYDNWADFYYLNNIKNVNLQFIQEYKYFESDVLWKQKKNILLLINKDNLAKIRDSIIDREINIIITKGKFLLLDINPKQL